MKERYSFEMDPILKPLHANLMRIGMSKYLDDKSFRHLIFELDLDSEWNDCWAECKSDPNKSDNAFFLFINIIYSEKLTDEFDEILLKIIVDFLNWNTISVDIRKVCLSMKAIDVDEGMITKLTSQAKKINKVKTLSLVDPLKGKRDLNKVFIIHGHDKTARLELENLLKEEFKLNPVVIQERPNEGLDTIISKFERLANECATAIALFTPDDKLPSANFRARQNVVLEFGYFLGRDQSNLDRKIIILQKGNVETPSDINGVIHIRFNESVNEVLRDLKKQLRHWKIIA